MNKKYSKKKVYLFTLGFAAATIVWRMVDVISETIIKIQLID